MKNRKIIASIIAGFLAVVMVLSLLLSLLPTRASAASSSEIRRQINDLKKQKQEYSQQMKEVKEEYKANEDEIADMIAQKNVIDQEITLLYQQIDNINQQISAYAVLIADKQDELDDARTQMAAVNDKNKERIRAMEEDGTVSYWSVLFNANSFSDLLDRLSMVEEIAASDQRRLDEMSAAAEKVAIAQGELQDEKSELDDTKKELDDAYLQLEDKRAESQRLLSELIAKGVELQDQYKEYMAMQDELLEEISQKEAEFDQAKLDEWLAYIATMTTAAPETLAPTEAPTQAPTEPPEPTEPPTDANGQTLPTEPPTEPPAEPPTEAPTQPPAPSATWLVPCSYIMVSSPFGERVHPITGVKRMHQGVDLAGREGTPIIASRSGAVTAARYSNSAGNFVTINHGDGYSSIYMHMTHSVVSAGQYVSAGQVIGYMGSTGMSTGNHLHFGIMQNGVYVNPAYFIPIG